MKDKDKELLDRINDSINKEYGLDSRTPISDTQRSLREMVEQSINQYFENLGREKNTKKRIPTCIWSQA